MIRCGNGCDVEFLSVGDLGEREVNCERIPRRQAWSAVMRSNGNRMIQFDYMATHLSVLVPDDVEI